MGLFKMPTPETGTGGLGVHFEKPKEGPNSCSGRDILGNSIAHLGLSFLVGKMELLSTL